MTKRIRSIAQLSLYILFFISATSYSAVKPFMFENLIKEADYTAHIEVQKGNAFFSGDFDSKNFCGYIYTVKVLDDFDSGLDYSVNFYSYESMSIGSEYLILLTDDSYPNRYSKYNEKSRWFEECISLMPELRAYADHGFLFKFVKPYYDSSGSNWVLPERFNVYFKGKVDLKADEISFLSGYNESLTGQELEKLEYLKSIRYLINWEQIKEIILQIRNRSIPAEQ